MCTYLAKRGAVYSFRRPIPENLRAVMGKRVWFASLKTKDREAAKCMLPLWTARTNKALAEAAANLTTGGRERPKGSSWEISQAQLEAEALANAQEEGELSPPCFQIRLRKIGMRMLSQR